MPLGHSSYSKVLARDEAQDEYDATTEVVEKTAFQAKEHLSSTVQAYWSQVIESLEDWFTETEERLVQLDQLMRLVNEKTDGRLPGLGPWMPVDPQHFREWRDQVRRYDRSVVHIG